MNKRHGESWGANKSPEYNVYSAMIQRATNLKNSKWKYYGGRGIGVCDRWRESYPNFLIDMGRKPTPEHTLDRIDNDKGYSADNCRWATREEQRANQRPRTHKPTGDAIEDCAESAREKVTDCSGCATGIV
jgi:hypothetical protein